MSGKECLEAAANRLLTEARGVGLDIGGGNFKDLELHSKTRCSLLSIATGRRPLRAKYQTLTPCEGT
jgi:hypothetical protein